MNNKFKILDQDREFSEKILKMSSETEILQAFREKGIEVNREELLELRKYINKIATCLESLDKSELEQVAGGNGLTEGIKNAAKSVTNWFTGGSSAATAATAAGKAANITTGMVVPLVEVASGAVGYASKKRTAGKLENINKQICDNDFKADIAGKISTATQGVAVASVAFAMCYYGKDFVKWWMKKK